MKIQACIEARRSQLAFKTRAARMEAKVKTRVRIPVPTRTLRGGATCARNVVEPKESFWPQRRPTQRRQRKNNDRHGKRRGNQETKLQLWSSSRNRFQRLASFETRGRSPHLDSEGWLGHTTRCGAKTGIETEANECSPKTDSGELISNRGGLRVQGTTEYGYGVTFQGRRADVHKPLISASRVHKQGHAAVWSPMEATSSLKAAHFQEKFNNSFNMRLSKNLVRYVCIWRMAPTLGTPRIQQHV